MRGACYVWNVVSSLAWWGAVVVVTAVLASMTLPLHIDQVGAADPPPDLAQTVDSNFNCETTEVKMNVAEGRRFSHYSLKDGEGDEVVRVMYDRTGRTVVTWGEKLAVRAACLAKPGGSFDVTVVQGESTYRLLIRPDATSGFTVSGGAGGVQDGLGVTAGGNLIQGPSILH